MARKLQTLQAKRRTYPGQVIQKNGWQLYSPYFPLPFISLENLEDLDMFYNLNFIENIKNNLLEPEPDYQDNLRIWIR
jgi:hypothetical protein